MGEFKQFLQEQGVLELFARAIIDDRTKFRVSSDGMHIVECVIRLIDWSNTYKTFGNIDSEEWRRIHSAWAHKAGNGTRITLTTLEFSKFLLKSIKKRKLHAMVNTIGKGLV